MLPLKNIIKLRYNLNREKEDSEPPQQRRDFLLSKHPTEAKLKDNPKIHKKATLSEQ